MLLLYCIKSVKDKTRFPVSSRRDDSRIAAAYSPVYEFGCLFFTIAEILFCYIAFNYKRIFHNICLYFGTANILNILFETKCLKHFV